MAVHRPLALILAVPLAGCGDVCMPDDETYAEWYVDADGDGFGDAGAAPIGACSPPDGHSISPTDCDDADAARNPDADELCNALDDDCDAAVDEDAPFVDWYADRDADGYGDAATAPIEDCAPVDEFTATEGGDCDDDDPDVHRDQPETCDGIDQDCDGVVDDGAIDAPTWYRDADGDTYGDATATTAACSAPPGHVADATDCDDASASVFPGALEVCNDADDDCDGTSADERADGDGDSFDRCEGDCDDGDALTFPGGNDVCDAKDQDCDGYANDAYKDAKETNDTEVQAVLLGGDDSSASTIGDFSSPHDLADYFAIDTINDGEFLVNTFNVNATVTNLPSGAQLELHVYREDIAPWTDVASDTNDDDGLSVTWAASSFGFGGGGRFYIVIERVAGFDCTRDYTLTVSNGG